MSVRLTTAGRYCYYSCLCSREAHLVTMSEKKNRNQFVKMYLINTIYSGKNLFLSQLSVWHVAKSLQLPS